MPPTNHLRLISSKDELNRIEGHWDPSQPRPVIPTTVDEVLGIVSAEKDTIQHIAIITVDKETGMVNVSNNFDNMLTLLGTISLADHMLKSRI